MADQHGRYEQLAVGHVLGGLDTAEAADFRSHLLTCSDCRTRVAELRDIATELEAAERDERAQAKVRTELPRRAEPTDDQEPRRSAITVRHVTVATVVVLMMAGAMAFWNLHLRTTLAARTAVAEAHSETLRELASGVEVPSSFGDGVNGIVVADEDRVALSLVGVDDVAPGTSLVAWLRDDAGEATADSAVLARPGALDGGTVSATLEVGDAVELLVTRESATPGAQPSGEILVEAQLSPAAADP